MNNRLLKSQGYAWMLALGAIIVLHSPACSENGLEGDSSGDEATGWGSSRLGNPQTGGGGVPGGAVSQPRQSPTAPIENTADTSESSPGDASDTLPDGGVTIDLDALISEAEDTVDTTGDVYECELGDEEECITECGSTGLRTCGKFWGPCIPPEEVCNGLDDDCNGQVDDDLENPPTEEVCDGEDNDCDGVIDNGLSEPCLCDPLGQNTNICTNGVWSGCAGVESGTTTIEIPGLNPDCPWGEGDNLSAYPGGFAARVEQVVQFNMPEGGELCGFSLSGLSNEFYYDDELLLLFNDVPLIGSSNFVGLFDVSDGLPVYDWSKIVGKTVVEVGQGVTCLPGALECTMPGTQSSGQVSLSFDAATNQMLAYSGSNGSNTFTLIVTGDNDPADDCQHSGLTMLISYQYYPNF